MRIKNALVAAAVATTMTTGVIAPATAVEGGTPICTTDCQEPGKGTGTTKDLKTTEDPKTTGKDKSSMDEFKALSSNDDGEPLTAKEIKEWIGVITAVIGVITTIMGAANKFGIVPPMPR